jgi:hypothetical protein
MAEREGPLLWSEAHRARQEGEGAPAAIDEALPGLVPEEDRGRVLACARCRRPVTTTADRIEVAGGHAHSFANPHGFRYHIGCFAQASGCRTAGPPSTYWTWFPPYAWQVEHCGSCGEHLGWLFRADEHRFHGLILDRLVEVDEDRPGH